MAGTFTTTPPGNLNSMLKVYWPIYSYHIVIGLRGGGVGSVIAVTEHLVQQGM